MPMSDKEIAVWQNQGNRTVRATPTDTAGHAEARTGCIGAAMPLIGMIINLVVWYLVFLIAWPW